MVRRVARDLHDQPRWQITDARDDGESAGLNYRLPMRAERTARLAEPQPRHLRSSTPVKPDAPSRRFARPRLTFAAGGLIFASSFVAALLLTKPTSPPTPAMMMLAASSIFDLKTLMAAVKTAGLRGSPDVRGAIGELTRVDNDQIRLKGWAMDTGGGRQPLTVMAFVDGHNSLTIEASGRFNAAVDAPGLAAATVTSASFEGRLKCSEGQKLIVVAVAQNGVYGHFGSRLCP